MIRPSQKFFFLVGMALILTFSTSLSAKTWWDKNRGGWVAPDTSAVEDAISEEVPEVAPTEEAPALPKNLKPGKARRTLRKPAPSAKAAKVEEAGVEEVEAQGAYEEEVPAPAKTKKLKKRTKRKIASISDDSDEEVAETQTVVKPKKRRGKAPSDRLLRVGLVGGFTKATIAQSAGTTSGAGSIIYAGGQIDAQWDYLGFEFDGYYGTGTGTASTAGDAILIRQNGALASLKGQIPLRSGSLKFTPKLGLGYGTMGQNQDQTGASGTATEKSSIAGVYAEVGFDFEPFTGLLFVVDYSRSVAMVKATFETTAPGTTTTTADLGGSAFQRIRVSASYKIVGGFYVGSQVAVRSFLWGFNSPIAENQMQVMGLAGWEF